MVIGVHLLDVDADICLAKTCFSACLWRYSAGVSGDHPRPLLRPVIVGLSLRHPRPCATHQQSSAATAPQYPCQSYSDGCRRRLDADWRRSRCPRLCCQHRALRLLGISSRFYSALLPFLLTLGGDGEHRMVARPAWPICHSGGRGFYPLAFPFALAQVGWGCFYI